jgi:hypothetical protein
MHKIEVSDGKTTRSAPEALLVAVNSDSLAKLSSRSNETGAACTAATLQCLETIAIGPITIFSQEDVFVRIEKS